jgi:hypothetical protein
MKTKTTVFILASLLLCISSIKAQTYYYNTTKTFNETGYTYQGDVVNGDVTLYNKSNTWTYVRQTYKDGSPLGTEFWDGSKVHLLEEDTWTKPKCYAIVNDAFDAYFTSVVSAALSPLPISASALQKQVRQQLIQILVLQQKQRIQGTNLSITMIISPDTGKVMEVNFWFLCNDGFATIPVSVYRSIETKLKSDIWFTPTTQGKNLNYIMRHWMHEVK